MYMESVGARKSTEYNAEYYRKNKKFILTARAARYKDDPEYRNACRDRRRKAYLATKTPKSLFVNRRTAKGVLVKVMKVGTVLVRLRITRTILYHWEAQGLFPEYGGEYGTSRCYSKKQVDLLTSIATARKDGKTIGWVKSNISPKIFNNWG